MKTEFLVVKKVIQTYARQLAVTFGVDQPTTNQIIVDNNLIIAGWVIGTNSIADKIMISGGINMEIFVDIQRPDILIRYKDSIEIENFCPLIEGSRRCGFSKNIPLPQSYIGVPIDITAVLQDGGKIPLAVITFANEMAESEHLPHPEMLKAVATICQPKINMQFFHFNFGNMEAGYFLYSCRSLSRAYLSEEWPDLTTLPLPKERETQQALQHYAVFVSIIDQNQFVKQTPTLIELFPKYLIEDLNNKKCSLILDYSNEPAAWWLCVFIRNGLRDIGIHDFRNVMLITQNRLLNEAFTDFSIYEFNYWMVYPVVSLHAQLNEEELWNGYLHTSWKTGKPKNILCLNATPRQHRWLTVATLVKKGMLADSLISFPGENYSKNITASSRDILAFAAKTAGLENLDDAFHWLLQNTPLKVDDFPEEGNALVNKIDFSVYEKTILSIVTESEVVDHLLIQRITEKTLKAFAIGHPSVIVGLTGSIKLIEELGFDVFHDFIDHSYDQIDNWVLRMNTAIDEAISFCEAWRNGSIDIDKVQAISQKNRDWLHSGFFEHYSRHFAFPILSALSNKQ